MKSIRSTLCVFFLALIFAIAFSPCFSSADPLDNWHQRNPLLPGISLYGVTYGNGTFVAVDYSSYTDASYFYTSPDGVTWTFRYSPSKDHLYGITYGNGVFIAVGTTGWGYGTILTSPEGETWTLTSGSTCPFSGVTYGNSTFVAVPRVYDCNIGTSPDGVTWTWRGPADYMFLGVTYGNGKFVAVGYDDVDHGVIVTSPDGITWTWRNPGTTADLYEVTYGNGKFVAVGLFGTIVTSTDGVTWTKRNSGTSSALLNGVTYGNGIFVAVGSTLGPDFYRGVIVTSPDGVTWTKRAFLHDYRSDWFNGVTYGNGTFVAVGYGDQWGIDCATFFTSPDGITWTERANRKDDLFSGVTYGNGTCVAVGQDGIIIQTDPVCTLPIKAVLSSPSDGATGVSTTPALDWGEVSGAISYDVQVCSDSGCLSKVASATVSGSQWTVSPALSPTTTYYWRVKAKNSCGSSSWSEIWKFKTKPTITVTSPNGGENWQAGTTHTINWTYTGKPGSYVKIELFKNGILKSTIKFSKPIGSNGSGYHNWSIPVNQKAGCDYQIKITSTTNSLVKDKSNGNFCIYQ